MSDETLEERTERMIFEGAAKGVFRQCSIGWHFQCSDWSGLYGCRCPCHIVAEKAVKKAQKKGLIP